MLKFLSFALERESTENSTNALDKVSARPEVLKIGTNGVTESNNSTVLKEIDDFVMLVLFQKYTKNITAKDTEKLTRNALSVEYPFITFNTYTKIGNVK